MDLKYKENSEVSKVDTSFLECHICLDILKPPIFLCNAGHSLCCSCRAKVTSCPTCKKAISSTQRNFQLESIVNQAMFVDCSDCEKSFKFGDLENHSKSCIFRPIKCCYCLDHIQIVDLKKYGDHLNTHVTVRSSKLHTVTSFDISKGINSDSGSEPELAGSVMLIHFESMYFHVEYGLLNGLLSFWIRFIGDESQIVNYEATISIYKDNPEKGVKFLDKIYSIRKPHTEIISEVYSTLRISRLQPQFGLDKDKILRVEVDIKKKENLI